MKKSIFAICAATLWIAISEFVRNQFVLKSYWLAHYAEMGQPFPEKPINGAIWGLWSLTFAIFLQFITRKFSLTPSVLLGWIAGFLMMWLVLGNLSVLPFGILPLAIPLSFLEVYLAVYLIRKFNPSML